MPLEFDATLKGLARAHPLDLLALLDPPPIGPVEVLSPDLSTVSAFPDLVFRSGETILHIDLQSGPDPTQDRRTLRYNVLLHELYGLPVHSAVILLRRRAERGDLTGQVEYAARPGHGRLLFQYEVVRLWELPADRLLAGGVGLLPLATLGQLNQTIPIEEALSGVVRQVVERIRDETAAPQTRDLLTAAYILTGLRVSPDEARHLFRGVRAMRESSTFMAILDEGRVDEARKIILRQGRLRFGEPGSTVLSAIEGIEDIDRLELMCDRMIQATSWQDLLGNP